MIEVGDIAQIDLDRICIDSDWRNSVIGIYRCSLVQSQIRDKLVILRRLKNKSTIYGPKN